MFAAFVAFPRSRSQFARCNLDNVVIYGHSVATARLRQAAVGWVFEQGSTARDRKPFATEKTLRLK
jgi:hypothetical protein